MAPRRKRKYDSVNAAGTSTSTATGETREEGPFFDCSVCYENLKSPASITVTSASAPENQNHEAALLEGTEDIIVTYVARTHPSVSFSVENPNVSPTNVVTTHCGHMFHEVCVTRWFAEKGSQECPCCRNLVQKLIRFCPYPTQDSFAGGIRATGLDITTENLPSTSFFEGFEETAGPSTSSACPRLDCRNVRVMQSTLLQDFEMMNELDNHMFETNDVREAVFRSLEDARRSRNEAEQPQRQLDEQPEPLVVRRGSRDRRPNPRYLD